MMITLSEVEGVEGGFFHAKQTKRDQEEEEEEKIKRRTGVYWQINKRECCQGGHDT